MDDDYDYEPECTCHINPPCWYCTEGQGRLLDDEEME